MPQLKQLARQIFHETLAAIDIPATMQRKLRRKGTLLVCGETRIDLRDFEKLREVAIGKAAHAMVDGLALVLAPFVRLEGVVSAPTAARKPLTGMKYFVAGHSVPDALPRSTSFRSMVSAPPWARRPPPQVAQKVPAPAPAHPPSHAPLSRSPPLAVFRNLADLFSFHRTPATFPCAAASAASSREYRSPPVSRGKSAGRAASVAA